MNKLEIFKYEGKKVRTKIINEEIYFCLKDVAEILEIKNYRDSLKRLNPKGVATTDTLTDGGKQKVTFINESNLYKLVFQSRKSEAEKFIDWVTSEVLPSKGETMNLVKIENKNGINVVSSRVIAKQLGKMHKHVLESLENIIKNSSADISALFIESSYTASNGKKNKEYLLTKDGFTLYMFNIQGYNDFKMAYINEFNRMENLESQLNQTTKQKKSFAETIKEIIESNNFERINISVRESAYSTTTTINIQPKRKQLKASDVSLFDLL